LAAVALGFTAVTATAQDADDEEEKPYIAIRAAEADSLTLARNGTVTLSMMRAPSSSTGAKLLIVNSANFAIWEGDLTKSGANWTSRFNLEAAEALLTANAVHAEFPKAATGDKDLRISFVRDVIQESITASAALMGDEPMFYDAPEAPSPVEDIAANPDQTSIESYAMAARRYDEELAAYRYNLIAAKASAKALWTDLKTSGRLEQWPATIVNSQDRAYEKLDQLEAEVTQTKRAHRAKAKQIVDQWNAANPDASPVDLPFRDHSLES
jgi:hypothetical protein